MNKEHIKQSIQNARNLNTKLEDFIFKIPGMTNINVKILLNELCNLPNLRVCEVGSYKGSTCAAMLNNNNLEMTAISWWSYFQKEGEIDHQTCLENLKRANNKNNPLKVIDQDFYKVDLVNEVGPINFYFFDGPHGMQETFEGIIRTDCILEDKFLLIIDDYNDILVKTGTEKALKEKTNWKIEHQEILTESSNFICEDTAGWWNGIGIFLISKT